MSAPILLATYLRDREGSSKHISERYRFVVPDGNWRDEVSLIGGAEDYSRHARKVIESYVTWFESDKAADDVSRAAVAILRLMGLFNRPAEAESLRALREHRIVGLTDALFVGDRDQIWSRAVQRLRRAGLLSHEMSNSGDQASVGTLDCHPIIREHFSETLNDTCAAALREGHNVLYQHLQKSVAEEQPATLSALQPLYQAVNHGCLAGHAEDAMDNVFSRRILRRGSYSWRTLGAVAHDLAALACFFDRRWDCLRPGLTGTWPSWVFGESGFQLRNLGRLEEAIAPLERGLSLALELPDKKGAVANAGNLGELHMLRGRLNEAIPYNQQAVNLARQSGEFLRSWEAEPKFAWLLFQVGRVEESEKIFLDVEKRNDRLPRTQLGLHSMPGFWYCQLLLSRLEKFAYGLEACSEPAMLSAACDIIRERALNAFTWSKDHDSLLDAALDRLSLGRLTVRQ